MLHNHILLHMHIATYPFPAAECILLHISLLVLEVERKDWTQRGVQDTGEGSNCELGWTLGHGLTPWPG